MIIDCLLNEAQKFGVEIIMNADVNKIDFVSDNNFIINYAKTKSIHADFICIACGGFPKSSQFDWLKNLGHTLINPVPSLFIWSPSRKGCPADNNKKAGRLCGVRASPAM